MVGATAACDAHPGENAEQATAAVRNRPGGHATQETTHVPTNHTLHPGRAERKRALDPPPTRNVRPKDLATPNPTMLGANDGPSRMARKIRILALWKSPRLQTRW